jgi:Mlc titration factor MtfA (ptsG expression regulator)
VVSFEHGSIHGSPEWKDIFDENSRRLDITDYGKSNEAEFFATMFDMYYTDTETIQHAAPNVYDYIEAILDTEIRDDNMWQTYTQSYVNAVNVILSYTYETFRVY